MRSLRIATIAAAEADFLRAGRNEYLVEQATGAGSKNRDNAALWDAVSVTHGTPCRTFSEAFAACCVGRTMAGERRTVTDGRERILRTSRVERSWADFDLATLRECVPGLDLPSWVYEAQAEAAQAEWARGVEELQGYADEAQRAWYEDWSDVEEDQIVEEVDAIGWWLEGAADTSGDVDAELFGIEMMPVAPPLPAWAWR